MLIINLAKMIFKIDKDDAINRASKIKLVCVDCDGTMTDGTTTYSINGEETKSFSHIDGRGFNLAQKNGFIVGVITSEDSQIVKRRSEKLNFDFCVVNSENKIKSLEEIIKKFNILPSQVAFIGDDTNDIPIIKYVSLSFGVGNAQPLVLNNVNIICKNKGGYGAVREAIDFILKSNKLIEI